MPRVARSPNAVVHEAQVALFDGPNQPLRLVRCEIPPLREDEVLVAVRCCTLCGSDVHSYAGRRPTPTPAILGHEIVGEVIDWRGQPRLGDAGQGPLAAGQRVTWTLAASQRNPRGAGSRRVSDSPAHPFDAEC